MKLWEKSLVRERHVATTKAQSIAAIETALRDMVVMVPALDRYIAAEEMRTRITDVNHIAYSTIATAARGRANCRAGVVISPPNA